MRSLGDRYYQAMTSEQPARREEKKAISRRRILEAAREIFFRDGFMAANLDHVAHRAGVAKGTLYRYFESKADLYVAVLGADGAIFEQKMRDTIDPSLSATDQVRATGLFYFEHWMNNRQYFQIFWAIENETIIGDLPREVVVQITKLWEECLEVLSKSIERGVASGEFRPCDPWGVANILWTTTNGLLQRDAIAAHHTLMRKGVEQIFHDALDIIIRGLKVDPDRDPPPGRRQR